MDAQNALPAPPVSPAAQAVPNSQLAIASLVLGVLSWFVLPAVGAIGAVVCGHLARRDIRASRGALGGDGLAVGGLALGYVHLAMLVIAVVVGLMFLGGLAALLAFAAH